MKKFILLLLTIGLFSNCSNDDDNQTNSEIVGEWKLTKAIFISQTVEEIDYTDQNIVYNFHSNGVLSVSGGANAGYPIGEYEYIFGEDYLTGSPNPGEPMIVLVKIGNAKWTYDFTNGQMKIGQSYVDGPDLVFERN